MWPLSAQGALGSVAVGTDDDGCGDGWAVLRAEVCLVVNGGGFGLCDINKICAGCVNG